MADDTGNFVKWYQNQAFENSSIYIMEISNDDRKGFRKGKWRNDQGENV